MQPKQKQEKSKLINLVKENLTAVEAGLKLFDACIPTVLGETIDIVALDKHKRLVMLALAAHKVPAPHAEKFALKTFYCWNFICDFRDDFFAEAQEKQIKLALKPPRLLVLVPEASKKLAAYLKHFQDCYIDTELYSYTLTDSQLKVKKEELAAAPKLKKSELNHFNVQFRRMALKQLTTWENWLGDNPLLRGYDKERSILDFVMPLDAEMAKVISLERFKALKAKEAEAAKNSSATSSRLKGYKALKVKEADEAKNGSKGAKKDER